MEGEMTRLKAYLISTCLVLGFVAFIITYDVLSHQKPATPLSTTGVATAEAFVATGPSVKWLGSPITAVADTNGIGVLHRIEWEYQLGVREDGVVVWRKR
jgi:hypothetical protein